MIRTIALAALLASGVAAAGSTSADAPETADAAAGISAGLSASAEYALAAAAQPGDPLSDLVLARMLGGFCSAAQAEACPYYPAPLWAQMVEVRERLAVRVEAEMPHDPTLLAVGLDCWGTAPDTARCDGQRARLAETGGDNAYSALVLMAAAWRRHDDAGFLAAAALGARASHYTPAYAAIFASMRERLRNVPDAAVPEIPLETQGIDRATSLAMNSYAAFGLPAFQWFIQPCLEADGELLANCLAIARKMVRSNTATIDVTIGATLLEKRGDAADQALALSRRREATWLAEHLALLSIDQRFYEPPGVDAYFDTFAREGELPAMRALLEAHGLPPTPPADWVMVDPAPAGG